MLTSLVFVFLVYSTVLNGYVGCHFLFHMAALKNDTATYVLMVFPTGVFECKREENKMQRENEGGRGREGARAHTHTQRESVVSTGICD